MSENQSAPETELSKAVSLVEYRRQLVSQAEIDCAEARRRVFRCKQALREAEYAMIRAIPIQEDQPPPVLNDAAEIERLNGRVQHYRDAIAEALTLLRNPSDNGEFEGGEMPAVDVLRSALQ